MWVAHVWLFRHGRPQSPEGNLTYTYYSTGKVESIQSSNANGANVSYTYDSQNRLSTVTDNRLPGNNTTIYTYDPASNVVKVAYPNGVTSTITYDELNRLTELSTSASGTQLADYKDTLGSTGNRTKSTEQNEAAQAPGRTLLWTYNGIYQLTNETIIGDPANNGDNNGSATYTLDPVGNRTGDTSTFSGINPIAGSFNPNDEMTSSETYDLNGNVTSTANGNSYVYDSENHMIRMSNSSTTVTMMYDAFGNRVSKTVNGVTTQYLVEDDVNPTGYPQVLDELTGPIGSGAVSRTYTYGLQRISQVQIANNELSYYQYDGGGSVRQLTNSSGVMTDSYEYDAFGNSFTKTGTTPNNYLYRGEQYDSDLGLYYLRARYYNTLTGRFVSMDPEDGIVTDPKTLHKYVYAGGDPVNAIDPTGRATAVLPWPRAAGGGGDLGEYALAVVAIGLGSVAVDKTFACSALNTGYDVLAKSLGSLPSSGLPAIPVPAKCSAKCPPCVPPVGTECMQSHSGHTHNGWDPHYHLWKRGQVPSTCQCRWDKIGGSRGGYQFPIPGLSECSSIPTWPAN